MALEPLLAQGVKVGEGVGALLALPLVRAAAALAAELPEKGPEEASGEEPEKASGKEEPGAASQEEPGDASGKEPEDTKE